MKKKDEIQTSNTQPSPSGNLGETTIHPVRTPNELNVHPIIESFYILLF